MNYEKFPDNSADELRTMFPEMTFFDSLFDPAIKGINLEDNCVVYSECIIIDIFNYESSSECRRLDSYFEYLSENSLIDISKEEYYKEYIDYYGGLYEWIDQIKQPRENGTLEPQICDEPFESRCTYTFKKPEISDSDGITDDLPY